MKKQELRALVENLGQKETEVLGIDLSRETDEEIFKWFLVSVLFGAPITESAVIKTYKCFEKHRVLTPKGILDAGWDRVVEILDEGGTLVTISKRQTNSCLFRGISLRSMEEA